MKLQLDLLQTDLASYRFDVSPGWEEVSQILITWIKLLSKQLGMLTIWPSKSQEKHFSVLRNFTPKYIQ